LGEWVLDWLRDEAGKEVPLSPNPALRLAAADPVESVRDVLRQPAYQAAAPLLVNEREAARLLRVSPRTVWQLNASGELPCVRLGRAKRYAVASLQEFVARVLTEKR